MTNASKYAHLSREQLESRLAAAEDVCALYAWSPARNETAPEKASFELWRFWSDISGVKCRPEDFPHLTDAVIEELAARRDAARGRVLEHFFGPQT